jgi:hypothetical protein
MALRRRFIVLQRDAHLEGSRPIAPAMETHWTRSLYHDLMGTVGDPRPLPTGAPGTGGGKVVDLHPERGRRLSHRSRSAGRYSSLPEENHVHDKHLRHAASDEGMGFRIGVAAVLLAAYVTAHLVVGSVLGILPDREVMPAALAATGASAHPAATCISDSLTDHD